MRRFQITLWLLVVAWSSLRAGEVEYRYYRFTPTQLRVTNDCCVQLAEFEFLLDGVKVGNPSVLNPGGSNPNGETPDLAVDGSLTTKWLDFNQGPLVFDFGSATTVGGYRWSTANDAPERDPVRWILEGSDDETNWDLVDERVDGDFPTPSARYTYTPTLELNSAPAVQSFTVDRSLISSGVPVTLSWQVDPGTTGLSINQGVGLMTGVTTNGVGSISLDPGPTVTTVYEITATHANGDSTAQLVVTVTNMPVIHELLATPVIVGPGESSTLSWEVFNADSLALDGVAVTGDFLAKTLAASQTFTLSARNTNGVVTREVSVTVVEPGVPVINEFMANNDGDLVVDEDGADSDWIEIYNPSGAVADLEGYFLTDDASDLTKWAFPEGTLGVDGYLLVWASGKDRSVAGSEMHTNFSLKSGGEYLALVKPDGITIVSEFGPEGADYPDQDAGVSFGGFGEGQQQGYFSTATPGTENSSGFLGYVSDTIFSVDRGHFTDSFSLEISSETEGASIRYTTDGATPNETEGLLYTGPITVDRTMPVRAIAYLDGLRSTNVDTQTYLFVDDVVTQSSVTTQSIWGLPGDWSGTSPDYGMNPSVALLHAATIKDDLKTVPSLSLSMPEEDLFGSNGIYANPLSSGINWERATSLELIDPSRPDGSMNFQIDCGMRIQGGAFRRFDLTKKKSFRLLFKGAYGDTKLRYPLFGDLTTDEFDTLIFRMESNDGYQWDNRTNVQYARDQFGRRSASEIGIPSSRGRYFHIYLNGVYWGVYNVVERPDVSFGKTHFGAEKEDWDGINFGTPTNDSLGDSWNTLVSLAGEVNSAGSESARTAAYMKVQGLNPDGSNNEGWADFLNVDNMCDYLLVNWYTGNADWPQRNYYTGRERDVLDPVAWRGSRTSSGTHFFMWDVETSMFLNSDRDRTDAVSNVNVPFGSLRGSKEFQVRMGDRAHRALFNGGALTADEAMVRYADITKDHRSILIPELARWGDQHGTQRTIAQWESAYDQIQDQWLSDRSPELVEILRASNYYPDLDAPSYSQHGGDVSLGGGPSLSVPVSIPQIYYVFGDDDFDETSYNHPLDPRLTGGGISPSATLISLGDGGGGGPSTQFVSSGDSWKYLDDGSDQGIAWRGTGFADGSWAGGPSPLGYGDGDEAQVVGFVDADPGTGGIQKNATTYFRKVVAIATPSAYGEFKLDYVFDDAIAIYVNGSEVERIHLEDGAPYDQYATLQSDENETGTVILDPAVFVPGNNTIAVEIHQLNGDSSDMSFDLELRGQPAGGGGILSSAPLELVESGWLYSRSYNPGTGDWSALNAAYFSVETEPADAANLVVSEFSYRPAEPVAPNEVAVSTDRDDYEFIELMNIGNKTIDLTGVEFTSGIGFSFPANSLLGVGERVVLVSNTAAFSERYPTVGIGGVFSSGNLRNGSEQVVLASLASGVIRDFTYEDVDPWPSAGDGAGYSLVLIAPATNPDHMDPLNWRSSADIHGAPGGRDGVSYAEWKSANGITDDFGDPDGDGLSNLGEFASGSDFQVRGTGTGITGQVVNGFFEVEIQRNLRAVDEFDLVVESSEDLMSWADDGEYVSETNLGNGVGLVKYRVTMSGSPRKFVRVRWMLQSP
ncbi:MAG: lamin tail domain-containing protein [Akkermansiaceae bacterium]|nr:lamin tail domain-containing protein [Akkermansiaceae bacterium]